MQRLLTEPTPPGERVPGPLGEEARQKPVSYRLVCDVEPVPPFHHDDGAVQVRGVAPFAGVGDGHEQ